MRILVIDKLFQPRSGVAETDMYLVMQELFDLSFDLSDVYKQNYDVLLLGAYHFRMGLDIKQILEINKKPVFVCQADNEEFAKEPHYKDVTVICRYLPNESLKDYKTELLTWYIDPLRIPTNSKTCDVAFICSMNDDRPYLAKQIEKVCKSNNWTYVIGEYHQDYYELISKCRVMVIECSRRCLTLKYTEAILARCVIVGTKPIYPESNIEIIECNLPFGIEAGIKTALSSRFKPQPVYTKQELKDRLIKIFT